MINICISEKSNQYNSSDWNYKFFSEVPALSWPCCKDKWGLGRNCDEVSVLAYLPAEHFVFRKGSKLRDENKCCRWWMWIKREQAAVSQRTLAKSGRSTDKATKYKTVWGTYAVANEMLKQAASRCPFLLYLQGLARHCKAETTFTFHFSIISAFESI